MPINKMFFAQNVMPVPLPEPPEPDPDPDPGDPDPPIINPCANHTEAHPRWDDAGHNSYGSDWFGFKALPGGFRTKTGAFRYIGSGGYWWSSTEHFPALFWNRIMFHSKGDVFRMPINESSGLSIRLLRDPNPFTNEHIDPDGTVYQNDYEDGSGNRYDSVKIGDQIWTMKNLRTNKYQNGDDIATGLSGEQWAETTEGACAGYPASLVDGIVLDSSVIAAYGKLYNLHAVTNGLVTGSYWVPSDEEWAELTDYLILQYDLDESNVAMVLKSCRQVNHPLA